MCGLIESSSIEEYDPSKACSLWAEESVRKPSYSRAQPGTNILEECIIVDEESGCSSTSKQEDMIVDESSSEDESGNDFYCSESD